MVVRKPVESRGPARPGRPAGALVGLAVALLSVGIAVVVLVATRSQTDWLIGTLLAPTLATGVVCGWIFARRTRQGGAGYERGVTSLKMALLATAIGDLFVGFVAGASGESGAAPGTNPIVQGLLSAFVLWPFGIVFFGLIALPITFGASLAWATIMEWLGRASER